MSRIPLDAYLQLGRMRCPSCHGKVDRNTHFLRCRRCGASYPVVDGIPVMLTPESLRSTTKGEIQRFWGELYRAAHAERPEEYDRETFLELLGELEEMFRYRRHMAVTEMPIDDLKGKTVLEVGCGAGAHSALFARRGAEMSSLDITSDRVLATAKKLDWVPTDGHFALQGDAECLPFADDSFDIVYSNGVLHHTPDTAKGIGEVFRVLKPGGLALVMLYARDSFEYWVNLFLIRGVFHREMFRHRNWLGRITEWMASRPQRVHNPQTKVFSNAEVRSLFRSFSSLRIRKYSFNFGMLQPGFLCIPRVGASLYSRFSRRLERRQGLCRAGLLVYGAPWRNETSLELKLGRWIGYALSIVAMK